MERSKIERVLEHCELFKGLDRGDISEITGSCRLETYRPGDALFRQGDLGEKIYVIVEGHVILERSMDLNARSGKALIGMFGQGRVLGCWSSLLGEPHLLMSSALCQKPTTVVAIEGAALRSLLLRRHGLGFHVLERLCFLLRDRLQDAYGAMEKI